MTLLWISNGSKKRDLFGYEGPVSQRQCVWVSYLCGPFVFKSLDPTSLNSHKKKATKNYNTSWRYYNINHAFPNYYWTNCFNPYHLLLCLLIVTNVEQLSSIPVFPSFVTLILIIEPKSPLCINLAAKHVLINCCLVIVIAMLIIKHL